MPPADVWTWVVRYTGGITLAERDADGTEHGFSEVDLARVEAIELRPLDAIHSPVFAVIPIAATPVFFRRREIMIDSSGAPQSARATLTILGWEQHVTDNSTRRVLLGFWDNGTAILADGDMF